MTQYNRNLLHTLDVTSTFFPTVGNVLSDTLSPISVFTPDKRKQLRNILVPRSVFSPKINTSRIISSQLEPFSQFSPGLDRLEYIGISVPVADVGSAPNPTPIVPTVTLGPFSIGGIRPVQRVAFTCSGQAILLLGPAFGNRETGEVTRVNENTRGLTLINFRSPEWAYDVAHEVNFTLLDYAEVSVLRDFLRYSLGKVVIYIDVFGNSHTGFITSPEAVANSSGTGYSLQFTFYEGIPA